MVNFFLFDAFFEGFGKFLIVPESMSCLFDSFGNIRDESMSNQAYDSFAFAFSQTKVSSTNVAATWKPTRKTENRPKCITKLLNKGSVEAPQCVAPRTARQKTKGALGEIPSYLSSP